MIDSILNDLKKEFRSGHMVTRLIIINVAVYVVTALIGAFAPTFYKNTILPWIALPTDILTFFTRPWTLITYMFVHDGFFHVLFNMLWLLWFGRIVGDLIGDRHILPIYLLAGLAGAFILFIAEPFFPTYIASRAVGASAAVMGVAMVAGLINPDHEMRFLILGNIKIKWIVAAFVFFDLIAIGNQTNTGGHVAHLAGLAMGWYYVRNVGRSGDLGHKVDWALDGLMNFFSKDKQPKKKSAKKSPLKVKFKSDKIKTMAEKRSDATHDLQQQVDAILDKIKKSGYDSLTDIEKETLYKASKK